jgi:hypothetical protein
MTVDLVTETAARVTNRQVCLYSVDRPDKGMNHIPGDME